jgi:hypothetical protein
MPGMSFLSFIATCVTCSCVRMYAQLHVHLFSPAHCVLCLERVVRAAAGVTSAGCWQVTEVVDFPAW